MSLSGQHPPRALRVELVLEALEQTGHAAESQRLRVAWESSYGGVQEALGDLAADAPNVVSKMYAGPYGGVALTCLIQFPRDEDGTVQKIAESAADGFQSTLETFDDPRLLFAAAEWLHGHRQAREQTKAYTALVEQIVRRGATTFRFRGEPVQDRTVLDAELEWQGKSDRQRGRDLADYLLRSAR